MEAAPEKQSPSLDDCLRLLKGERDEQRLADLLLVTKFCKGDDLASLRRVYDAVGAWFLDRLLRTGLRPRQKPSDQQDEGLGIVAADGQVHLGHDHAAPLGEVLDPGDEGAGAGEVLGAGADADVEAHLPDGGAGDLAGDGEPDEEVAGEVHSGGGEEDEPGRGDLGDEAGEDADVGAEVLEEAEGG